MSDKAYLVLGYTVALGFLWGYAAILWWQFRTLRQREASGAKSDRS